MDHAIKTGHNAMGAPSIQNAARLFVLCASIAIAGCAAQPSSKHSQASIVGEGKTADQVKVASPPNPRHGDQIWGPLLVGMSVKEVLAALKGAEFDDQWASSGTVGLMAEAGIVANNKIKVTADIEGPFKSPSKVYVLFDGVGRLDGIVIGTQKGNLPAEVLANHGVLGYYLAEYKQAARMIIRYGIPELGARVGPPRFRQEQGASSGSVGIARGVGGNSAIGIGFSSGSISPTTIFQMYRRDGYKSMLSIRAAYFDVYNVYGGVIVYMALLAKEADDDIPEVE
jgi:hypothetical protein